jgi:peroxiredoxin
MNYRKEAGLTAALCAVTVGVLVVQGSAQDAPKQDPAKPGAATEAQPLKAAIDRPFKDFTLRNIASEEKEKVSLASFKGKKAVVAIFMANRCGTTWTYEERIGQLLKDYLKKDVAVVAVHSNYTETDKEIMGQMEQRNFAIPVLDDKEKQELAEYVNARNTPTFLVIDKEGILRYQGAYNKAGDETTEYLRPALDAVLSGKDVAVKTSRPFG